MENGKTIEVKPLPSVLRLTDGQFYSFSTVRIIEAAKKKWGERSRRVQDVYDLLAEMIHREEEP